MPRNFAKQNFLPWFTPGDLDGFFGLFLDNAIQLLLITMLCQQAVGLPLAFIMGRILPGAAVSIVFGMDRWSRHLSSQARRSHSRTDRSSQEEIVGVLTR